MASGPRKRRGAGQGGLRAGGRLAIGHRGSQSYLRRMAQLIVWHDGACPLCRREIALMRRLDRRGAIRFVDAANDGASCPIDRAALLARFHAREDGRMLSGAAAFAAMWRAIPLLRPLGLAARDRRVLALLVWGYLRFLRAPHASATGEPSREPKACDMTAPRVPSRHG